MNRKRKAVARIVVVLISVVTLITQYSRDPDDVEEVVFPEESDNITIPNPLYRADEVTNRSIPKQPVIVTGFSASHFDEAQALLQSVDRYLPDYRVIVYDLGLSVRQRDTMIRHCHCELRHFDWSRYPTHLHWFTSCAFKPVIINETVAEFGFVFWVDSSVRFTTSAVDGTWQLARRFGFGVVQDKRPTRCFAHPQTMLHLGVRNPRLYEHTRTIQAGTALFARRRDIMEHLIEPWLKCALNEDCIAPKSARLVFCKLERSPQYCQCHRYDQAALEILLYRFFGGPFDFNPARGEGSLAPFSLGLFDRLIFRLNIVTVQRDHVIKYLVS